MAILTVRNLPDDVHRALRVRAASHGRSTESEARDILANAVKPQERLRMGDARAERDGPLGLADEDFAVFDRVRDAAPAAPREIQSE